MKGLFVVFEGIAGSGKKTQIRLLEQKLREAGKEILIISFPDFESEIARLTRRRDFDNFTLSLLYAADRSLGQERIKSFLEKGGVVLCDRYSYSNLAYQTTNDIPLEWLLEIEKNTIKPNIVFFIDVPIEMSIKRLEQLSLEDFTKKEAFDRLTKERERMEKVRDAYMFLSKAGTDEAKWFIIDGTKAISFIHEEVWKVASQFLT